MVTKLLSLINKQYQSTSIIPLVLFRFLFGIIMAISATRFVLKGWIETLYLSPTYHFTFFGFEWIRVPSEGILYTMYGTLILTSLMIAIGFLYRVSTIVFFFTFTYVQLMDKALYLNHYYFISLVAFLLIILPAHHNYSVDALMFKKIRRNSIPQLFPNVLKMQIGIVYFFAGVAKVNYEWLFDAMPLKIWLQSKVDFPILGYFFQFEWTAYFMSWAGAIYDLTVPFLLLNSKTRKPAFVVLVIFHLLTWFLFNIGMFPWIMMLGATLFFSAEEIKNIFPFFRNDTLNASKPSQKVSPVITFTFIIFILIQILVPLRVHWLRGDSWNEFGYRYSWNVMRVEKTGYAEFRCYDPTEGKWWTVYPASELSIFQQKQMAFQPDMILAYAHHIASKYENNIQVYADVWVSKNGKISKRFIDPNQDLLQVQNCGFCSFDWVLPE